MKSGPGAILWAGGAPGVMEPGVPHAGGSALAPGGPGDAMGATPGVNPNPTPGVNPNSTPGVNPNSTPGVNPGATQGTEAPPPGTLRRLTAKQYQRVLVDLLGELGTLPEPEALPAGDKLKAISASTTAVGPVGVEQFEKVTNSALSSVFGDAARRTSLVGCDSTSWNQACATSLVQRFGLSAWRRPLTPKEVARYVTLGEQVTSTTGSFQEGARAILSGLLQSPYFLYRVELGGAESRFTPHEVATRLSFTLWGTAPDTQLLKAAESGALNTEAGISVEAARLLSSPRLLDGVLDLTEDLLRLDSVFLMAKDPNLFPQLTPTLRQAMWDEVVMLVQDTAVTRDADLTEIFSTTSTFVNEELGALYGIDVEGPEMRAAQYPTDTPRSGILTTALLLSVQDKRHENSPTKRGAFVAEALQCLTIPPPPADVPTDIEPADGEVVSFRELLRKHRVDPACAGCHALMDPVGLSFENFDALGQFRTEDENGLSIDASGEFEGVSYSNPQELGRLMRASKRVRDCLIERVYSYAAGRTLSKFDRAEVARLAADLGGEELRLKPLMKAILSSDTFHSVLPPGSR